jgi:hypothetical protein
MSSPEFILTTSPFGKDDIPIGTFVPDRSTPSTDAIRPYEIPDEDISKTSDKNFDGTIRTQAENWFQLLIARFLSFVLHSEKSTTFHVTADEGFIYMLRQPKEIFKLSLAADGVKEWLEDNHDDQQDIYFVIGYRTFVNAKLYRERNKTTEASGKTEVPVSEGAGDPIGSVNIGLRGGHKSLEQVKGGTETTGERIYAICFRRVKITREKKELKATLKSSQWQPFATTRGKDENGDVILEAVLDDVVEIGNFEIVQGRLGDSDFVTFIIPSTI